MTAERARRWAPLAAVALAFVLLGIVAATPGGGSPLDPNGTSQDGAKALVLLLRRYGATVVIASGTPSPDATSALVLHDVLDRDRRDAVDGWVGAGGHLVVADPLSQLQLGAVTEAGSGLVQKGLVLTGPCSIRGLESIQKIDVGPSLLLRVPPGGRAVACFGRAIAEGAENGTASFLLQQQLGQGTVTALGGAGVWTNQRLGQEDNAGLAVALLAPAPGAKVDVLVTPPLGSGHESTYRLIGPRLRLGLYGLLLAFVVLALWRGRRLGQPVPESEPVRLAGSEIVVAVGDLLARTGAYDAAAAELRAGARRAIGERVGLGPGAPADRIADVVHARSGTERAHVETLLADAPVAGEDALVALSQSLVQLRQEVVRG